MKWDFSEWMIFTMTLEFNKVEWNINAPTLSILKDFTMITKMLSLILDARDVDKMFNNFSDKTWMFGLVVDYKVLKEDLEIALQYCRAWSRWRSLPLRLGRTTGFGANWNTRKADIR